MPDLHQWLETLWWTKQPPLPLRLLSRLYYAISRRHLERRAARAVLPSLPLISVGNITAGGSGKTPFVIWLAAELRLHGYAPVILCRGDGGASGEPTLIAAHHPAGEVGDEARLLFERSGCPVIAGRDRLKASRMAAGLGNVIILDDGFQYRQLGRCCDIVLIPAEGVGNGQLIPAGPLREPIEALKRADIIVRTGNDDARPLQQEKPEWHWQTRTAGLRDAMHTGAGVPTVCMAATGIARPKRFLDDLHASGLIVDQSRLFPDHYRFGREDVATLLAASLPVVVTGKDAVKLAPLWPADVPLWILEQEPVEAMDLLENILDRLPELGS